MKWRRTFVAESGRLVYSDVAWAETAERAFLEIAKFGHHETCDLRDESVACFCPYGVAMRTARARYTCVATFEPHRCGEDGGCSECLEAVR